MAKTPDFTLSTGRVVTHKRITADTEEAFPASGEPELTEAEWNEYCRLLRAYKAAA